MWPSVSVVIASDVCNHILIFDAPGQIYQQYHLLVSCQLWSIAPSRYICLTRSTAACWYPWSHCSILTKVIAIDKLSFTGYCEHDCLWYQFWSATSCIYILYTRAGHPCRYLVDLQSLLDTHDLCLSSWHHVVSSLICLALVSDIISDMHFKLDLQSLLDVHNHVYAVMAIGDSVDKLSPAKASS